MGKTSVALGKGFVICHWGQELVATTSARVQSSAGRLLLLLLVVKVGGRHWEDDAPGDPL